MAEEAGERNLAFVGFEGTSALRPDLFRTLDLSQGLKPSLLTSLVGIKIDSLF